MMAKSVVLPAPFGPISAVMRPAGASNEAWSTAKSPPKRFEMRSTRRSGSGMGRLRCRAGAARPPPQAPQVGQDAGDAARREGHHEHQHATVDNEIEAGRIAGDELRRLAERFDHQGAEQRAEHRAGAADDRRE